MANDVTVNINGHETVSQAARAAGESIGDLSEQTKRYGSEAETAGGKTTSFIRSFTDIKSMIDVGVGAVKLFVNEVKELALAYAEQEREVKLFDQAMSLSGGMTDAQIAGLKEYASTIQTLTGVEDETVLAFEKFLSMAGRSPEQIKAIIDAAVNLSAATGDDLGTTIEQLNLTFSGSAGRIAKLIPELASLTEEQLKQGAAVSTVYEKYKGLADVLGDLADTKLKNAANAFGDAKAAIGGLLVEAFGPAMSQYIKEIESMTKWVEDFKRKIVEAKGLKDALDAQKSGKATKEQIALIDTTKAKKEIEEVQRSLDLLAANQQTKFALIGQAYTDELSRLNNEMAVALAAYKVVTGKAYIPGMAAGGTAAPGVALVGEEGPELVIMHGSETVIPNDRLTSAARAMGIPGYAAGTKTETGSFLGAFMEGGGGPAAALSGVISSLVGGLGSLFGSLGQVQAILNPISTMLKGLFEVIGPLINEALAPLVGILKIVGQVMGKTLAPVIDFLGDVIRKIAEGLLLVINGVIDMINWVLPKKWEIDKVTLKDATAAGQAESGAGYAATGASASYSKPRDITMYIEVNTGVLVGSDGKREFAVMIKNELMSAGVLGMA